MVAILVICRSGAWWPWCMMGYGGDSGSRCGEGVGDGGVVPRHMLALGERD